MLETKEQKQNLVIVVVLIISLIGVSLWNRGGFRYSDETDYQKRAELSLKQQEAYEKYLKSIKIDPVASRELYEEIISEEDIRKEVEADLNIDQKIITPELDTKSLSINISSGEAGVVDYFENTVRQVTDLKQKTSSDIQNLFIAGIGGDSQNKILAQTEDFYEDLHNTKTPEEALKYHVAQLTALQAYINLLRNSQSYSIDSSYNPWPKLYHDYSVMNEQMAIMDQTFDALNQKYAIEDKLQSRMYAAKNKLPLIKTAEAALPVIDIKAIAEEIYKEALATAFARFAVVFLDKLITKIDNSYKIANFLYYTDAVVSGQYVNDYLDKYVAEGTAVDRRMIRNFIPQLNCGTPSDVTSVLKAQASRYLGFDPASVDVNDPNYFIKMAKVGDFLSSPTGWEIYYRDVARLTQSEAEKAAQQELISQGFKSSRDQFDKGNIATAGVTALSALRSAFQSYLDLGTSNSRSFVSKMVSGLVQTFFNKFVFKGVVLKEQRVCLAAAQITPVLPVTGSIDTEAPPIEPNPFEIEDQFFPR